VAPQTRVRPLTGRWALAGAIGAAALACGPAVVPSSDAPRDGTRLMADTLAAFYAQARSQPERYEYLNAERVAAFQYALLNQPGGRGHQARFGLARERLLAGHTREAIGDLEALGRSAMPLLRASMPGDKPFFDLLGIAYLRLAEQDNCNLHPNASVCILGQIRHAQDEGARAAIGLYEALLGEFPQDHGSQWLLNIAYMAVGEYPAGVPRRYLIPNLTHRRTSFPRFTDVARDVGVDISGRAGGLCVADFTGDGLLDLLATAWGFNDPIRLLVADGRGGYADRASRAGLAGIVGGPNCTHADYDNDGHTDVYIMRGGWLGDGGRIPNSLLRNRGDGTFEDVTFAAGLGTLHPSQTAAWTDFNLDGWLDLFVGNESGAGLGWSSHRSELFLNNRDGTFTDVATKVGVDVDAFVKGSAWGDVNNDGWPDLFVSIMGAPNRLYLNKGGCCIETWRFEDISPTAGTRAPDMSFPAWFWDYDNDGWEDLLVLSFDNRAPLHDAVAREFLGLPALPIGDPPTVQHSHLYRNRGNGTFEDVSRRAGLSDKVIHAMGSNFGDIDNDGWLDFYAGTGNPDLRSIIPNRMFRNMKGRGFEEITVEGGFGHLQKGHGTAFVDLDRDGDEDVFMVMGGAYTADVATSVLFENPGWPGRNWITLELEGRTANRSAIGARVEIVVEDSTGGRRSLRRTVSTGSSFGASALQLHLGLGPAVRVPVVRVSWPDSVRSTTTYGNLALGRSYRLVQGDAPRLLERAPVPFRRTTASLPPASR